MAAKKTNSKNKLKENLKNNSKNEEVENSIKSINEDNIINVTDLKRTFKTFKKGEGFKEAMKSLFNRKKIMVDALKGINFKIKRGEKVGFLGPNGAGKSTAIKIMTGILYPTSGEVKVLKYIPWKDRRKYVSNIGVIFGQKSQLWLDLPPIDAFYLSKNIYKISDEDFNERLNSMVKLLNLQDIMHRPTRDLSLGERMKCEFILALLHNPPVLFLDEPTIGVDAIAKDEIRTFLSEINKKYKTTLILTTHDMDDIEELCDRLIIIDEGSIIYDGSIDTVKQRYVKWKTIDFEFNKITNSKKFSSIMSKGVIIVDGQRFKSIRFEKSKYNIAEMVSELMSCCDIVDLTVHEPRLENIIKEIYLDKNMKNGSYLKSSAKSQQKLYKP